LLKFLTPTFLEFRIWYLEFPNRHYHKRKPHATYRVRKEDGQAFSQKKRPLGVPKGREEEIPEERGARRKSLDESEASLRKFRMDPSVKRGNRR